MCTYRSPLRVDRLALGELELTMMKSFCAASNLKNLLRSSVDWSESLKPCFTIFSKWFAQDKRGTLMTDIRSMCWDRGKASAEIIPETWEYDSRKLTKLDTSVHNVVLGS